MQSAYLCIIITALFVALNTRGWFGRGRGHTTKMSCLAPFTRLTLSLLVNCNSSWIAANDLEQWLSVREAFKIGCWRPDTEFTQLRRLLKADA